MEHISLRLISAIVLVLLSMLFLTPLAPAKPATKAGLACVFKSTHNLILAEATPKTNQPSSEATRRYLADMFAVSGFKTSRYDTMIEVEVTGETAIVKANLSRGDKKIMNVCGAFLGFVYTHLTGQLGIRKVKILESSAEVFVFCRNVMDDCLYTSSRNTPLKPTATQLC